MIERTAGRILRGLCAIMLAGVAVDVAQAGETAGIPPEVVAEYIHRDHSSRSDHLFHPCRGAAAGSQGHCGGGRMESERDVALFRLKCYRWLVKRFRGSDSGFVSGWPAWGQFTKKTGLRISSNERPGSGGKESRALYGNHDEVTDIISRRYLRTGRLHDLCHLP